MKAAMLRPASASCASYSSVVGLIFIICFILLFSVITGRLLPVKRFLAENVVVVAPIVFGEDVARGIALAVAHR